MYHDMKKKPFFRHFLLTAALAGCISSGCLPEALSLCFPPFQGKDSPFSSFLLRTYAAEESTAPDHSTENIKFTWKGKDFTSMNDADADPDGNTTQNIRKYLRRLNL